MNATVAQIRQLILNTKDHKVSYPFLRERLHLRTEDITNAIARSEDVLLLTTYNGKKMVGLRGLTTIKMYSVKPRPL